MRGKIQLNPHSSVQTLLAFPLIIWTERWLQRLSLKENVSHYGVDMLFRDFVSAFWTTAHCTFIFVNHQLASERERTVAPNWRPDWRGVDTEIKFEKGVRLHSGADPEGHCPPPSKALREWDHLTPQKENSIWLLHVRYAPPQPNYVLLQCREIWRGRRPGLGLKSGHFQQPAQLSAVCDFTVYFDLWHRSAFSLQSFNH